MPAKAAAPLSLLEYSTAEQGKYKVLVAVAQSTSLALSGAAHAGIHGLNIFYFHGTASCLFLLNLNDVIVVHHPVLH